MKVFLQKHQGEFANINLQTAYLGFRERGYDTRFFEFAELDSLALDQESIVVGGIPVVLSAMRRLSIEPLPLFPIPDELCAFAKRRIWTSTIGEVRGSFLEGERLFIKPLPLDRKLFNGQPLTSFRDLLLTSSLPMEYPILCSDLVNFRSEYRVFVIDREIIGMRFYHGDFRLFPDFKIIEAAVADYHSAPSAYGIDFGVTAAGETILVEVNDSYALGCYGLSPALYSALIERRWNELLPAYR